MGRSIALRMADVPVSRSTRTVRPWRARAREKLMANVVLPTPPLPDEIGMMRLIAIAGPQRMVAETNRGRPSLRRHASEQNTPFGWDRIGRIHADRPLPEVQPLRRARRSRAAADRERSQVAPLREGRRGLPRRRERRRLLPHP